MNDMLNGSDIMPKWNDIRIVYIPPYWVDIRSTAEPKLSDIRFIKSNWHTGKEVLK